MRILVLDDDKERHQAFARNFDGHDVVHVETYDSALAALLKQPRFDVVYLDHDLNDFEAQSYAPGDSMYEGPRELDGQDVAVFMARELPESKHPELVVVHSWNPSGADAMVSTLRRANFSVRRESFHVDIGR